MFANKTSEDVMSENTLLDLRNASVCFVQWRKGINKAKDNYVSLCSLWQSGVLRNQLVHVNDSLSFGTESFKHDWIFMFMIFNLDSECCKQGWPTLRY